MKRVGKSRNKKGSESPGNAGKSIKKYSDRKERFNKDDKGFVRKNNTDKDDKIDLDKKKFSKVKPFKRDENKEERPVKRKYERKDNSSEPVKHIVDKPFRENDSNEKRQCYPY